MCVCALDIHRSSLTMVLLVKSPVPIVLEGCSFCRPVEPPVIMKTLKTWETFYQAEPLSIVACPQDPWPDDLEGALQSNGYYVHWIEHTDILSLKKTRASLNPDRRWHRGGLMTSMSDISASISSSANEKHIAVLEWMYAALRYQIEELEAELSVEGRELCPGHISQTCPLCDTWEETFDEQDTFFFEEEVSR